MNLKLSTHNLYLHAFYCSYTVYILFVTSLDCNINVFNPQ